jgi:hypothetical protein
MFSTVAKGIIIKPDNFLMPTSAGEQFSFDLVVEGLSSSFDAKGFQSTVELTGAGVLTFDDPDSQAVSGDPSYWLYGNSAGANARDLGGNMFEFGDGPSVGTGTLDNGLIVARYAFSWDGTAGIYMFSFDLEDLNKNYVFGPDYESYALQLPTGDWYSGLVVSATADSFNVQVPEPATLLLFALGFASLLRRSNKKFEVGSHK